MLIYQSNNISESLDWFADPAVRASVLHEGNEKFLEYGIFIDHHMAPTVSVRVCVCVRVEFLNTTLRISIYRCRDAHRHKHREIVPTG
jgi:hypothetical protein